MMKIGWAAAGIALCAALAWEAARPPTAAQLEARIERAQHMQRDAAQEARRAAADCSEIAALSQAAGQACFQEAARGAAMAAQEVRRLQDAIDDMRAGHVTR